MYSTDDAVARQKEAQGPWGVCWPWCSAVGFLGPRHDFAAQTDRALQGRHLGSWCSLQLQEVDVFLHPPGIRVRADLPPLPGGEPVEQGGVSPRASCRHPPSCSVTSIGFHRGHLPSHKSPRSRGTQAPQRAQGPWENLHATSCLHGTSFPSLVPGTRVAHFSTEENESPRCMWDLWWLPLPLAPGTVPHTTSPLFPVKSNSPLEPRAGSGTYTTAGCGHLLLV